jgi:galactokinase
MTGLLSEARRGFERAFGYAPEGIWSAPGRVNLIGEHTDYNEGFVLPFAIDRRTFAALARRDDGLARVSSSRQDGIAEYVLHGAPENGAPENSAPENSAPQGTVHGWAAYPLGVAWGLGQVGADLAAVGGFDVHFVSDVPLGAGLSSSAALESSLAVALNDVWGLGFDRARLVQAAHLAENDFVGAPTGILDQSASLLSVEGSALFIDCRDGSAYPVDLQLDASGLSVLVIDTKVNHEHASGGYAARRASCEKAARALGVRALRDATLPQLLAARGRLDDETYRRARHVITEDERVADTVEALRTKGPSAIGDLMSASHRSMRDDFEISTPELDLAVDISLECGATGARMTGGGFGGSTIALAPNGLLPRLRTMIDRQFSSHDYTRPEMFTVRPSPGARRDR